MKIFKKLCFQFLMHMYLKKKKHLRTNHASFVTKELRKPVMKRARLRNVYLKKRTEATKAAYNYQ